jgi:transposase
MTFTLPDARSLTEEVLEALRLRALHARQLGFSECDIADILGVCRVTVSRWCSAYTSGGLEALPHQRSGRPVGSGRTLTDAQAQHLQEIIDQHTPQAVGIAQALWTRQAVRDLILREYGLALPIRTVGEYLKRWGYTPHRPRRRAHQQDPDEVRQWLEQTYPALVERAAEEGAEIYWCDEVGVDIDSHPGRGYARSGQAPVKEVTGSHARVNAVSAINHEGDAHFLTFTGTLDEAVFLTFLQLLLQQTSQKLFLILDSLRVHGVGRHGSAAVAAWVAAHADRIELIPLPKYTPERNPVEYLNNDTKEEVNAQGLPRNQQELHANVDTFLHKLSSWPERIISYFCHPAVQYAATTNV